MEQEKPLERREEKRIRLSLRGESWRLKSGGEERRGCYEIERGF